MNGSELDLRGWSADIHGIVGKADASVVVTVYGLTADSEKEALVRGTSHAADLFKAHRLWPKQGVGHRPAARATPAPVDDDAMPGFQVQIAGEVHEKVDGQARLLGQVDARFALVRADSAEAAIARAAAALGRQLEAEVLHVTGARATATEAPRQPQLPLGAVAAAKRIQGAGGILEVPSDVDPATGEVDEVATAASRRRRRRDDDAQGPGTPAGGAPSGSAA